jgi:hypothetical protein
MNNQNDCLAEFKCVENPEIEKRIEEEGKALTKRLDTLFCEEEYLNDSVASACMSIFMKCCKIRQCTADQLKKELYNFFKKYTSLHCRPQRGRKYE